MGANKKVPCPTARHCDSSSDANLETERESDDVLGYLAPRSPVGEPERSEKTGNPCRRV